MNSDPDDAVFRALADSTRRRVLDLLRERPRTTGELSEQFATSRFAVMKHLQVLVAAGLVLVERRGRERWNRLNPAPIQRIQRRWLRRFDALAASAQLDLKDEIETQAASAKRRRTRA